MGHICSRAVCLGAAACFLRVPVLDYPASCLAYGKASPLVCRPSPAALLAFREALPPESPVAISGFPPDTGFCMCLMRAEFFKLLLTLGCSPLPFTFGIGISARSLITSLPDGCHLDSVYYTTLCLDAVHAGRAVWKVVYAGGKGRSRCTSPSYHVLCSRHSWQYVVLRR
ncbi:hypothetical protein F4818DRAFT_251688 [Hypoxylon cercidicola]|nr:hypothetical protein F4818DRAFT_251688 [Hypoxylon cercidicola]